MHTGPTSARSFRVLTFLLLAMLSGLTLFIAPGHSRNAQTFSSALVSLESTGQTGTVLPARAADVFWVGATKEAVGVRAGDGSPAVHWSVKDLEDIAVDKARGVVWTGSSKEIVKYDMDGNELFRYSFPVPKGATGNIHGKEKTRREDEQGERENDHEDDQSGAGRIRISLDPSNGSLWVGVRTELLKLSSDGRLLLRRALPENVVDVSVDIADGSCWAGLPHGTVNYSADGQAGRTFRMEKGNLLSAVTADPRAGSLWIGTKKGLIKIDRHGSELVRTSESHDIQGLASDTAAGALWLITKKEVFKYDHLGRKIFHLKPCPREEGEEEHNEGRCDSNKSTDDGRKQKDKDVNVHCNDNLIALAVDPSNGASFLAWRKAVLLLNSDGAPVRWFEGFKQIEALDVGLPELSVAITAPENASVVDAASLTVTGSVNDPSAKVTVNGREASMTASSFEAQEVPLIVGENTLIARATNLARLTSTASITVLRQSSQPSLTVKIDSPRHGDSLRTSRVTVAGTVSDPAATIVVNGVQAVVSGNSFAASGVPIVIGDNILTVSAFDPAGQSASDAVTVRHAWLTVEILYPGEGEEMTDELIYVDGVVSDPAAKVMVNGREAWVDAEGYFSASNVKLMEGWNEIVVQATDREGRISKTSRQLYYKQVRNTYPSLQVLAPADGSIISSPTFTVFGIVNDPTAEVIVNDVPAQITGNLFSAVVHACVEGETIIDSDQCEIVISVYTNDGNTAREAIRYRYDPVQEPLIVVLADPARRSTVISSPVEVRGEVRDALSGFSPASVEVNGIAADVYDGVFYAYIPLEELWNTITVHARNMLGHDAYDVMQLLYEPQTTPLAVRLTSPVDGAIVNRAELAVTGIVSDSTAHVDINGVSADKDLRSFVAPAITLAPGENTLIATAVRLSGETATAAVRVTYDPFYPSPVAPILAGLPPLVRSADIEVAGAALPLHEVEIVVNGEVRGNGRSDSNGLFQITAALTQEGPNHVSARVRDAFGNTSGLSNEALVGRDTLPPLLTNVFLNIDSLHLRVSRVFVSGQTEPFADLTVKIDSDPDLVYHDRANDRGEFSTLVLMSAGKHLVTVIARDPAGNTSSNTHLRNVFPLDRNRPLQPRLDPLPSPISESLVAVEGSGYARFEVELYRNNELVGAAPVDARGRFRFEGVNLVPGTNIIRARQKEGQFNLGPSYLLLNAADSPEVVVEVVAGAAARPAVSIDFPMDGSVTAAAHIPLRGTIDTQNVWMLLNGSYFSSVTGAWTENGRFVSYEALPLLPGPNTLWAEAIAPDGSRGVHKITVHHMPDAEAPKISIISPEDHSLVYSSPVAVAGTSGLAQKIIVNEAEATMNGEDYSTTIGLWGGGYTYRPDTPGNVITAWAMDEAGRIGHHEVAVGYKYVPVPVIEVTSPADGQVVDSASLTLSGTAFNASELSLNGASVLMEGNAFSAEVDLREGMNSFNIIAKNGPKAAAMNLTVYYYPASQVSLQSVVLMPDPVSISLGKGKQVTAIGTYSDGRTVDLTRSCIWASGDEAVALVNKGYVQSKRYGRTTVTAQCDSFMNEVRVAVNEATIEEIQVAYERTGADGKTYYTFDDPRLNPGDKIAYRAVGTYADGVIEDLTALATWTSSNPAVAAPDSKGSATALALGTAGITATYNEVSGSNTLTVVPPVITLIITSPTEWSVTDKDRITVKGAVFSKAAEVGVRVNGMPATVSGNQFVANHVPLTEWNNVIKVVAKDTNGATAEATVVVFREPSGNPLRLAASIESGIAPLETVIRIDGVPADAVPDIKAAGPGSVEFVDCAGTDSCKIRMITEGVYTITVESVGYDGNTYSDSISITVLDKAKLDALLKGKWEGMKGDVIKGNTESGLNYFVAGAQDRYRAIFTNSSRNIAARLSEITRIEIYSVKGIVAQGGAIRLESNDEYAYPLTFVKDQNGMWKIMGF